MKTVSRILRVSTRGMWHFAVGDSPEFIVVVLAVVGFALAAHRVHLVVVLGLPLIVAGVLASSVRRAQRNSRRDR